MTKIYYFSGTGNTLWSAKYISEKIGGAELLNIGAEACKDEIILEADAVVLLFPSYGYGLPIIVRRFMQKAVFKTPYLAVLVTYGTQQRGTLAEAYSILKRKKIDSVFYADIPAVENYLPIFGAPSEETVQRRTAMQREASEKAAAGILERQTNTISTFRPLSAFVSSLFALGIRIFYKHYRVSEQCNGCGICEKMCPVQAVSLPKGRPVFSGKCEHCIGCIHWCPPGAISFWGIKPHTARYHHPEIAVSEMTGSE